MAELPTEPAKHERDFWEANFHDPPRPRREQRLARHVDPPWARLTDRLRDWRADARFGVVALVIVAVVAGVIWYRVGIGGASADKSAAAPATTTLPPSTLTAGATTGGTRASSATSTGGGGARAAQIAVHVAGAVAHPGVVELGGDARVIDAVEAVGGALADGDLDRLNLAARLSDGQRVYVAKVGQPDVGATTGAGADAGVTGTGTDPAGGGSGTGVKVNLNTATQAQLEELPGIGPTYAQSIIAERQRRGGFKSVNDLRSVRGIGDKRFAELAPLVSV